MRVSSNNYNYRINIILVSIYTSTSLKNVLFNSPGMGLYNTVIVTEENLAADLDNALMFKKLNFFYRRLIIHRLA